MLALSVAATALSDLTAVGQPAATPDAAEGFLALLNAGSNNGNDIWSGNDDQTNNNGNNNGQAAADNNSQAANNPVTTPISVPTSIFAANNSGQQNIQNSQNIQNNNAPAPQSLRQTQQSQENASSSANNQTQNAPTPLSTAPTPSAPSSNTGGQNTVSSVSSKTPAPVIPVGAASGNNIAQSVQQLRTQIQDQLDNINQILLSMIQALSAGITQQLATTTTAPTTTPLSQIAAPGNDATGSTDNGQLMGAPVTPSQPDQEIALLKDMQSLLQQLEQTLSGQGQGQSQDSQQNVQTLSDSLLSDMTKLSQLGSQPFGGSNSNTTDSLLGVPQFGDLKNLLKNSIAQIQSQLQALQTTNETIFAQATANLQTSSVEMVAPPKTTQDNSSNNISANAASVAVNVSSPPITQDVTVKLAVDNTQFNALPVVQVNVSQNGGNSAGSGNQDSSQNQTTQPVIAAATSSSAPATAASGPSFVRILNQVSQGSVLDQVQFQVKTALSDGSSKITIQLNPPELGKVDVKIEVNADGKTNGVTIVADNKNTLDLLQRDTQGLTRALNDAGLTTDSGSLNFSLSGGGENQMQGNQQAAITYQQAQPEEEDLSINTISRSYVVNLAEGLDITI